MDDWNALRLVLAVQRAASLTEAAVALGIDHSTAYRRLKALEQRLGVQLFDRLPGGLYRPTEAGARMAASAEKMEDEALELQRDLLGRDRRLSGRLRVTSSETLAHSRLTRLLAGFRARHPGIRLELAIDNRVLSLARREADIALRPLRPRQGNLWGRRLSRIAWTLYASPSHPGAVGDLENLGQRSLVGWEEGTVGIAPADWLARKAPPEAFVYRTNSLVNQLLAAQAGIGVALLPYYLGDPASGVVRVLESPIAELTGELWIVTHTDLRNTARVRAFFDVVGEGLARERELFEGNAPKS